MGPSDNSVLDARVSNVMPPLEEGFKSVMFLKDIPRLFSEKQKEVLGNDPDAKVIAIVISIGTFNPKAGMTLESFDTVFQKGMKEDMDLDIESKDALDFALNTGLIEKRCVEELGERFFPLHIISPTVNRLFDD
jgi:hypothetical protein